MARRLMFSFSFFIAIAACVAAATLGAQDPDANEWRAFTTKLEQAVLDEDVPAILAARTDALRLAVGATSPERGVLARYAAAYAGWRLAFNPAVGERVQNDLLDEAETQLLAALKIDAGFADGLSLLSGVYGAKIAKSPVKGIILGPKSTQTLDKAMALEPENPRVLLAKGVSKFNTPAAFGGSAREAETLLRRALAKFAEAPAGQAWPNWGRVDAHAWLGQVLADRGDKPGALAEYEKALVLAPKSGWIRYVLLPALK